MTSTGIIRRIDELGRVVIPKEIRRTLHIHDGDPLEIGFDGEAITLSKYTPKPQIIRGILDLIDDIRKDCSEIQNRDEVIAALHNAWLAMTVPDGNGEHACAFPAQENE